MERPSGGAAKMVNNEPIPPDDALSVAGRLGMTASGEGTVGRRQVDDRLCPPEADLCAHLDFRKLRLPAPFQ